MHACMHALNPHIRVAIVAIGMYRIHTKLFMLKWWLPYNRDDYALIYWSNNYYSAICYETCLPILTDCSIRVYLSIVLKSRLLVLYKMLG